MKSEDGKMHELVMRMVCRRPDAVKAGLEPDISDTEDMRTEIRAGDGFVEITVRASKMNHLKAVMNSYLSIVEVLDKVEDIR